MALDHPPRSITVCSVMRDLGIDGTTEAGKHVAWTAGAFARNRWKAMHDGARPAMRLTQKTRGGGTHEKAHYPEGWRTMLEKDIQAEQVTCGTVPDARQCAMFGA